MRLGETLIPKRKHDAVEAVLEDEEIEYTDPVPLRQPERIVVTVGTDSPPVAEETQPRESVRAKSTIPLSTGPVLESHRPEAVVHDTEQGRSTSSRKTVLAVERPQ